MRNDKARQIVSEALIYRGFSKAEADKLIKLIAVPIKDKAYVTVSKTIDVYV